VKELAGNPGHRALNAAERIAHDGVVVKLANGAPVRSPWVGIANGALDRVVVLLREFGGSPAARSRVALAADASPAAGLW
jgi:P27 family predicted phage terminase small subunit